MSLNSVVVEETVKKHSALTQLSGNKMTAVQKKLYTTLIFLAREAKILDNNASRYYVKYSELKRLAGITSPNNTFLHTYLEEMMSIVVKGNLLGKDKENRWSAFPVLSGAKEIDDHFLMYSLPPQVEDVLLHPNVYAMINFETLRKLQSKYAVSLYELVCDYRKVGTGYIQLSALRDLLGVNNEEYVLFKDFNKYVIKRSLLEIEKAGGGKIDVSYLKENGSVTHIRLSLVDDVQLETNNKIFVSDKKIKELKDCGSLESVEFKDVSQGKSQNDVISQFKQRKLGGFINISDGTDVVSAQVVAVTESAANANNVILVLNIDGNNIVEELSISELSELI